MEEEKVTVKNDNMVAGIDLSLCSPAICIGNIKDLRAKYCTHYYVGTGEAADNYKPLRLPKGPWETELDRCYALADWVITRLQKHFVHTVYVESIAFRAVNFDLRQGMATQVLHDVLKKQGFDVRWVNLSTVKKRATNNGRANKHAVYKKYLNSYTKYAMLPIKQSARFDVADSYFILLTGEQLRNEKEGKQTNLFVDSQV